MSVQPGERSSRNLHAEGGGPCPQPKLAGKGDSRPLPQPPGAGGPGGAGIPRSEQAATRWAPANWGGRAWEEGAQEPRDEFGLHPRWGRVSPGPPRGSWARLWSGRRRGPQLGGWCGVGGAGRGPESSQSRVRGNSISFQPVSPSISCAVASLPAQERNEDQVFLGPSLNQPQSTPSRRILPFLALFTFFLFNPWSESNST